VVAELCLVYTVCTTFSRVPYLFCNPYKAVNKYLNVSCPWPPLKSTSPNLLLRIFK
jgi:hypothetical protein